MTTKFFSHDEPSALAYEANQMTAAGYADEALALRHQPGFTGLIASAAAAVAASLTAAFKAHDLPAALAYELSQSAAASYRFETLQLNNELCGLKNRSEAIRSGAAAIVAWDKKLKAQNVQCCTTVHPVHSYNPR